MESFILGLGIVNEIWPPSGDMALKATRAIFKPGSYLEPGSLAIRARIIGKIL